VAYLARRAKLTIEETLIKMRKAGVDSMPAAARRSSRRGCAPSFATTRSTARSGFQQRDWRTSWASSPMRQCCMGTLRTTKTALTTCSSCAHCRRDRRFQTFIPLAFHPENTALDHLP